MALPERAYQRDDEVDAALRALGDGSLDRLVLSSALLFAEAERRTCTENDPGILMGMIGWGRPIRYLREVMRPKGWLREDGCQWRQTERGFPILSSSVTV